MKTKLILGSLLALSGMIHAQTWAGSTISTGNAYRSGNVGIGNTAPTTLLHVTTSGPIPFFVERNVGSGQINGLKLFFTSSPATGITVGGGSAIFQNQATAADILFMPTPSLGAMLIKSSGNVGIGTTTPTHKIHVSDDATNMVNNPQFSNIEYIEPDYVASYHELLNNSKQGFHAALSGYDLNNGSGANQANGSPANNGIGVFGKAVRNVTPVGFSFCIGVYGKALGADFNIGGVFYGDSQADVGNKQASGSSETQNVKTNFGIWSSSSSKGAAAFFNGDIFSTANYQNSDANLKSNVKPISKAIEKLSMLKPNSFTFKTDEYQTMNLPTGQQMGLDAQEVEKNFPELVGQTKDLSKYLKSGTTEEKIFKSVNYTNLIPLLIAGIQEQQKQLEDQNKTNEDLKNLVALQQQQINDMQAKTPGATGISDLNAPINGFSMDQNVPNPFSSETVIRYNLPQIVGNAYMNVYDLSGKQITSFPLNQKGTASVTITSEKLAPGIYIYSIVADGKIMDSKRMIVEEKH